MNIEDLTGGKFGRLTVVKYVGRDDNNKPLWECICECGKTVTVRGYSLTSGNTKSCGCIKRELLIERNYRHGCSKTSEHIIWKGMNQRCHNPNDTAYPNYGGRGITVCDRWRGEHGFENFLADIGKRPSKEYSIDRIDNSKGYSPDNCRWATLKQQANNKRNNILVEIDGELYTLPEACEKKGLPQDRIRNRVDRGMAPEKAISELDMSNTIYLEVDGVIDSISGWAKTNGLKISTVFNRINHLGWSYLDAVTIKENPRVHYIVINSVRKTADEWCEETGVPIATALKRMKRGMSPEEAVTKPVKKLQEITYNGITKPLIEWAKEYNMSPATLRSRLNTGWSIHDALNTPINNK